MKFLFIDAKKVKYPLGEVASYYPIFGFIFINSITKGEKSKSIAMFSVEYI